MGKEKWKMVFKISGFLISVTVFKKNKILIFFIIWSLWISAEFLLGPFSHVRIFDAGDSLLPQLIASKIQFQKYGISYLADYMTSGVDALAQSLVPLSNINSLIFVFLPPWLAYGLLMFTQRFLAGYFTYRLAKDSLKVNDRPAIIAGLLFSLLDFSINSFTLYHALGLPAIAFIIWSLEKINNKKPGVIFNLAVFGVLVGYINYFVYFSPYYLPFIFFWFVFIKEQRDKRLIINLIIFSLFTILPMIPNILAIHYNSQFSQRSIFNLNRGGFSLQDRFLSAFYTVFSIFTTYWPTFLMLAFPFSKFKFKNKLCNKLLITFIFSAFIPFFYILIKSSLSPLPVIVKSFSFSGFGTIIPFILALTVASFFNLFSKQKLGKVFILSIALIIIVSFKVKIEILKNYAPYRSLYQHPDLVGLAKNVDNSKWRVATINGGGVKPSYALANGLNTVDTYLTLYPVAYHKFWGNVIKDRISDDRSRFQDFMEWGNRVYLYGPDNFQSLDKIEFSKYYNLNLLSLANVKYIISAKPVDDANLILMPSSYREEIAKWSTWPVTNKIQHFLMGNFYGRPIYIYENLKAAPRFYFATNEGVSTDGIKIIKYLPDKIILEADTDKNAKLIVSINYYPHWSFNINGVTVPFERYLETFMDININKGKNRVILEYKPFYKIF